MFNMFTFAADIFVHTLSTSPFVDNIGFLCYNAIQFLQSVLLFQL